MIEKEKSVKFRHRSFHLTKTQKGKEMSKGGLAFLNKKSWHPSLLSNVEKVWKAEKKSRDETKKLEQLQKEIEQERQREELRKAQREAGLLPNTNDRMNWMVAGPASASEQSKEQYLLGKEFMLAADDDQVGKKLKLKTNEKQTDDDWIKKYENRDADAASKIREDPLLMMMAAEKAERDKIVKNPLRMKKLKKEIDHGKDGSFVQVKVKSGRRFDDAKARKYGLNDGDERRRRSRSSSDDRSGRRRVDDDRDGRDLRMRSRSRSGGESRSRRYRHRSRSYEYDDKRRNRSRSGSVDRHHSSRRSGRDSRRDYDDSYHRDSTRDHGRDVDERDSGKEHRRSRDSRRSSQKDRDHHSSQTSRKLTKEEREAKLKQMQLDAERFEEERLARIRVHDQAIVKEEVDMKTRRPDEMQSVPFLKEMSDKVYLGTEDDLQERISKKKHYLMRGHEVRGEDI
jgi:hypothetical protein